MSRRRFRRRIAGRRGFVRVAGYAVVLFALAGAGNSPARAAPCEPGLVEKVQRAYQAMRSFSGRFDQEDRRSDGAVERARGSIAYRKPGRMRWAYEPPHEQLLVTDGKTVWLFDPLLDNVTVQPLGDLTDGTPLAFLLGVGNLTQDFLCRPLTGKPPADGLAYLELLPRRPIPGLAYIQLGVHPATAAIGALRMVDSEGNVRQVRLRDLRTGVSFPPGHFTFRVTEDMEVITK